uniref:Mannosyltransferase n=1 Tax=Haemonchus contortus TaxID=6289 RepID=A0A7I4Y5L9_HAECO|nr:Alg9 mannosyltransferase domain containing protein [Haemonchus contortus]
MPRKNMSMVRRTSNRGDKPTPSEHTPLVGTAQPPSPHPSSSDTTKFPSPSLSDIHGKLFVSREDMDFDWRPSGNAVLKLLFSLRLSAALWSNISDCDEVYNYWEPLHLLLFGKGLQTWEYSPVYAIRSYFYIYLHYIPANILYHILPYSKIALFVTLRCFIGIFTLMAEFALYNAVCKRWSISIGRFFVIFSMLSTGMFISSAAFLPSSFAMAMNMYAMAAFLNEKWFYATFCTAVSALVGWPFAAVLGLPIVVDMLILRPNPKMFFHYAAISGLVVCASLLSVDSYYYGKRVLAPLNIVLYNVFSEHGPDLYGVEPLSYYLKNLVLNWNIAALMVPFAIPLSALNYVYSWKPSVEHKKWGIPVHPSYWRHYSSVFLLFASLSVWCMIFFSQPHKEERFLFPIYPLIALFAAITLDSAERLLSRFFPSSSSILSWLVVLCFVIASLSRTYALHRNFSAHIEVYKSLNEHFIDHQNQLDFSKRGDPLRVCVGKEWYRFPSSFFLPQMAVDSRSRKRGVHLHFLKSEFSGLLPKYYPQGRLPSITRRIPTEMNDLNLEEPSRYVPLDTCDYVVDLETPRQTTAYEPNYGAMSDTFQRLYSHPFLIASESHWFYRAFYIPRVSAIKTTFANYTLYQRIPPTVRT